MRDAPISDDSRSPANDPRASARADAVVAAQTADEFRAADIVVLDLTAVTPIVDYFVICTGTNRRQLHAIADEVDNRFERRGSQRMGREGYESSTWILLDYGDVVVHLFTEEMRKLYDLERLWADAPRIDWQTAS